jgi:deoxyribodipyrimidine photo-lyase
MILFWFRRDLRFHDNTGLYNALIDADEVLPAFIFDVSILDKLPKDDGRVYFIHQHISKMQKESEAHGSSMRVAKGNPLELIPQWCEEHNITAVFTNEDYEPYATVRDEKIKTVLAKKGIAFKTFKDQVIFAPDEVLKKDGTPYRVYTPFSRIWLAKEAEQGLPEYPTKPLLSKLHKKALPRIPTIKALGFETPKHQAPTPNHNLSLMNAYDAVRNFPAIDGTSRLGIHLRFGTVSIRDMVRKAKNSSNPTFLKELIWREFFMQILWHFPHTTTASFKPQYDRIKWRNNETEFSKWCEGNTGYALVDAGMRELNQTGFMHNRVRMLVGSFLCKHLLIDWRWGEAYFAEKLLDYEQSSNVGNWQWVAGCGVDAAPYFRVFNPTEQVKKFDKEHTYIKKWVPEYQSLDYPTPMVDHKMARLRCLETYKAGLAS